MTFEGQYLTYAEYQQLGGSAIGETPFNLLEYEARQSVDRYTFGRLKVLEEQLQDTKLCMFKLVNLINSYNEYETQNKGISSENTDGYSISYNTPSTDITIAKNNEMKNIIKEYLVDCELEDGTPYLYCGVDI